MENPSYYAIIPSSVRYNQDLTTIAKLLYGEITTLSNKSGMCFAKNAYFAELYGVSEKTITRNIKLLEKYNLIAVEYCAKKGAIKERVITVDKNVPITTDIDGQKCPETTDKNVPYNNTSINNIKEINNNKLLFTKKDEEEPTKNKKFQKPTLDEVRDYCLNRKNDIDPEMFIDFYESNGWKVGKNPMKDWKACVRTWEKKNKEKIQNYQSYHSRKLKEQELAGEEFLKGN